MRSAHDVFYRIGALLPLPVGLSPASGSVALGCRCQIHGVLNILRCGMGVSLICDSVEFSNGEAI